MSPFELLEHAPIPAYLFRVVEQEFVLEDVNAAARAQNPALAELRGKPMAALYRDQPQVIEDARQAVAAQKPVTRELPVRRYDRTEPTQYLHLTYVPAPPSQLVIFMREIASEQTEQTALRESEARYRSLVASLPDGILLRGADGRVLACNDVAVSLLGAKSQAALIGELVLLAPGYKVRAESGEPVLEADFPSRRVLRTGVAELGQVYALATSAGERWIRVAAQPIHSSSGAVTGSVTTYTDITDRVVAQREQRESAKRLDLALAAARMGVWEYDPIADTGEWSENLDGMFALGPREHNLEGFARFVHPDDRAKYAAKAAEVVSFDGDNGFETEFRIVGTDGVTRWARVQGRLSHEGNRIHMVGTVMDVTEQHRLEQELQRAHRLESIGRLAGGIAHDFNNLLAAMLGSLELVKEECPPSAREDLATAEHAAMRARDLTKQLLAFARKQPIEFTVVDLPAMVGTIERMLQRLVGPSIELAITSSGPVPVHADASSLEQVIVNLVVNARDAMPSGGRLEVRIGRTAGEAILEVSDSGVGMDAETRQHVFDPFFTTKTHGTGLGLASSYGIVKQHRGDIVVESEPGRGTVFRVLLPLFADHAHAGRGEPIAQVQGARKGCVLVIDDEDLVRSTSARVVRSLGYEVLSAGNAAEAIQVSREHAGTIDVLLCDVAMPGRDGPSIASELLAGRPGLKVIFASGYADGAESVDLANATFLQKPYTRDELLAKLREVTPD